MSSDDSIVLRSRAAPFACSPSPWTASTIIISAAPLPGPGLLSDGLIYFGERSVAAEYMSPTGRNFADGMVRYDMHPDFLKEFAKSPYMRRYDLKGPNGTPRIEFTIPVDKLERFNELTLNKTWIAINGSG
ncbi:hypothetical protein ABZX30_11540 [Streptomyces sp. NPDC004542]|uniref:hypothetical protein n=1 Tax=Streptomyces sp. NPDC004542 TaxID=3154281 RepID=UPI0033BBD8F6